MNKLFLSLLGLATFGWAATAFATTDDEMTVVSGFGTVGGVYNSNDKYGFVRNIAQETPPGREYSWQTDTRFGIQLAHAFDSRWQVVGQAVVRDQAENTLGNSISRAFVSYRPVPNLNLRVGRMADATFLMSDYCDVGYVYPWVRPPMESYGVIPIKNYDGADITYSLPDALGVWRLKGMAGRFKVAVPLVDEPNYSLEANDLVGLALIREQGPLQIRVGYSSFHLKHSTQAVDAVVSGLDQVVGNPFVNAFYPGAASEAATLRSEVNSLEGARIGFASAGFSYDDGSWMLQAEVSKL